MREQLSRRIGFLAVVFCFVGGVPSTPNADVRSEDYKTRAVFELVNHHSGFIKEGSSRIVAESAFVTRVHDLFGGKTEGLEVQFFTTPITEAGRTDILENGAKQLKRNDHATFVLFLDKENAVWQANLSYVIPGTTVSMTVAWKPEDLKKSFSDYQFDGKRLRLKSK